MLRAMIIVSATAWWAMPTLQIQVVDFMSFVVWALPTIPYRLAACGPNDDQGHAEYGEYEITVDIETGVVNGRFPRRALSAVFD